MGKFDILIKQAELLPDDEQKELRRMIEDFLRAREPELTPEQDAILLERINARNKAYVGKAAIEKLFGRAFKIGS